MVIFVDTSGWYALLDTDDSNHHRAGLAWSRWLAEDISFASSNYVLLETIALIQHRLGIQAVRQFNDVLIPVVQVHWIDPQLHSAAVSALLAAGRRGLSLVDCSSFDLMRRLGLDSVFAFDRHFSEMGFTCLP